jgi:hypothetical protein
VRFLVDTHSRRWSRVGSAAPATMLCMSRDYAMEAADDDAIFERAKGEDRILVSADTDFPPCWHCGPEARPPLILFRVDPFLAIYTGWVKCPCLALPHPFVIPAQAPRERKSRLFQPLALVPRFRATVFTDQQRVPAPLMGAG